jgi:hypothetical protein
MFRWLVCFPLHQLCAILFTFDLKYDLTSGKVDYFNLLFLTSVLDYLNLAYFHVVHLRSPRKGEVLLAMH